MLPEMWSLIVLILLGNGIYFSAGGGEWRILGGHEIKTTPYARSFRRRFLAFYYAVNHAPTNIILS